MKLVPLIGLNVVSKAVLLDYKALCNSPEWGGQLVETQHSSERFVVPLKNYLRSVHEGV
jgi:hypothetical protein